MADKLSQGLWHVLARHGVQAPSRANAAPAKLAGQRATSADVTAVICCDLSLDEATLARATGLGHPRAHAS